MATSSELLAILEDLAEEEFQKFRWFLQQPEDLKDFPSIPRYKLENANRMDTVTELKETYNKNAVEVAVKVLKMIRRNDLVHQLMSINPASKEILATCQHKLKANLQNRFQHLSEEPAKSEKHVSMNELYIELDIREESLFLEQMMSEDLFKTVFGQHSWRTLMTKGVSGIGKTVLTQKLTLDWSTDKVANDVEFMFPFTFRELNLLKGRECSWLDLIHHFFADIIEARNNLDKLQIVFIFDGLNESQFPLDFDNNEILTDITDSASVDVLLTNIIMGKLFPASCIWITTTPEAASKIPPQYIKRITEVKGFTDPNKEEYFRRRFQNKKLASRVISHITASRSLHAMCHIPVVCWITATVLEDMLKGNEREELPTTLTEMYTHFLVVQSKLANEAAETPPLWITDTIILSLGKLAFEQLKKGNVIFNEGDLIDCGINVRAALLYKDVFSHIFKEEFVPEQGKHFSFAHLSVQEFMAAVHVSVPFISSGVNILCEEQSTCQRSTDTLDQSSGKNIYQTAVDKALQSPNGHLNLFLRFLLGLSLQTNQVLLQDLFKQSGSNIQSSQEMVQYIRQKIRENPSPELCFNLFHCFNELKEHSLVDEIQMYLSSGYSKTLSPSQWSALVFILLSSNSELDVFDLKKFSASDTELQYLMPLVQTSSQAILRSCKLSMSSCRALELVLSSPSSNLRDLDLSYNGTLNHSVLANGLKNQECRLKTLRLSACGLTDSSCAELSSVLSCHSPSLKELDLSNNNLHNSGIQRLSVGLETPQSGIETLRLTCCGLTWTDCDAVAFFLSCKASSVRHLDLSVNNLEDSGVLVFSSGLESPNCQLETLRVDHGGVERLKSGLLKYACELTLDPNTAHRQLVLSEDNKKVTFVEKEQLYQYHPERFNTFKQVLCRNGLTGRCYWEIEEEGECLVGVTYKGISRRGNGFDCMLGGNDKSWSLSRMNGKVLHNNIQPYLASSHQHTCRVGVYLDWPAGILSFYKVSSRSRQIHLYTSYSNFTEPLYPGFGFMNRGLGFKQTYGSAVTLCPVDEGTCSDGSEG